MCVKFIFPIYHVCISSTNDCLNAYYIPDYILGMRDGLVIKTGIISASMELSLVEEAHD